MTSMEIAVDVPVGSLDTIGAVPVTVFGVIRFPGVIFLFTPLCSISSVSLAPADVASSSNVTSMEIAVDVPVGSLDTTGAVPVTAFGVNRFRGVIFLFMRPSASYISSWSLALSGVDRELKELMSISSATLMSWYIVVSLSGLYAKISWSWASHP